MLASQLERKRKRVEAKLDRSAKGPNASKDERGATAPRIHIKKPRWKKADIPTNLYGQLDGFLELEELDPEDDSVSLGPNLLHKPDVSDVAIQTNNNTTTDFAQFDDEELQPTITKKVKRQKDKAKSSLQGATKPVADRAARRSSASKEDNDMASGEFSALPSTEEDISLPEWQSFSFSEGLLKSLAKNNFSKPTAIQSLTMPHILEGRDVIGKASTGSGKTLAFGLPILEHIYTSRRNERCISALIMAPTRELAQQITQHLVAVSTFVGASVVTLTGGLAVEKQLRLIRKMPDIIVATPGRLWDLISSNEDFAKDIAQVRYVVLDEADRLLQKGHFKEITSIFEALKDSDTRQTLVFSATFAADLHHKLKQGKINFNSRTIDNEQSLQSLLSNLRFKEPPLFFDANPNAQVVQSVRQSLIETAPMEKDYLLYYLLLRYPARTLVFTNSISDVHRLTSMLNLLGIVALGLHSNKQQKARLKALERFKADDKAVLVASDVASRGLDIPQVDTVVHYHLPRSADLYVHRTGRTARAEARGLSIVLCSPDEKPLLKKLQHKLDVKEFSDFPMDANYVGQLKPRVNITREILKLEDTQHRESGSQDSWLAEAAADLGVDVVDEDQSSRVKQTKVRLAALRRDLAASLKKTFKKDLSSRYLTRGGAGLASRLLSGNTNDKFIGEKIEKPSDV